MMQGDLSFTLEKKFRAVTKPLLKSYIDKNLLIVENTYAESSLQSTSYDIRVGKKAIIGGHGNEINLEKEPLIIEAGSYAGIVSLEKFKLPLNCYGLIGAKRFFSYEGLILLTGTIIDPGYEGHLLFGIYNASTKKVVLTNKHKICSVSFTLLDHDLDAKQPDPSLLHGELPSDFVNRMANTEVLPWAKISDQVKQIQGITSEILELKKQYSDVIEPINKLTENIGKVNEDVRLLSEETKKITTQIDKLDDITNKNAHGIQELIGSIKNIDSNVKKVDAIAEKNRENMEGIKVDLSKTSTFVIILWTIFTLIMGAAIAVYFGG